MKGHDCLFIWNWPTNLFTHSCNLSLFEDYLGFANILRKPVASPSCLLMFHVNQSWPIALHSQGSHAPPDCLHQTIQTFRSSTNLWFQRHLFRINNMMILPSSSSLSSRLASLLSFLSWRSISALIRFCSCCSSERQHAITAAAIHGTPG